MKIRVFLHSVKESFRNIFTHPLLTLASITTMTLMLTLLGAFGLFTLNLSEIVQRVSQQPPVEIYLKLGADQATTDAVRQAIEAQKGTLDYVYKSSQENFDNFRASMGADADVLDEFDQNGIPASFLVRLQSPEVVEAFVGQMGGIPGVQRIDYSQTIGDALITAKHWINLGSIAVLIVLCIVAFFIISNMVRISVFSRGAEIEIMKYIGATNAYIRIPYILEGAITGLFGAFISWIILYFSYTALYSRFMVNTAVDSPYALLGLHEAAWKVMVLTGVLGVLVGMIGSSMSVRRHVKV